MFVYTCISTMSPRVTGTPSSRALALVPSRPSLRTLDHRSNFFRGVQVDSESSRHLSAFLQTLISSDQSYQSSSSSSLAHAQAVRLRTRTTLSQHHKILCFKNKYFTYVLGPCLISFVAIPRIAVLGSATNKLCKNLIIQMVSIISNRSVSMQAPRQIRYVRRDNESILAWLSILGTMAHCSSVCTSQPHMSWAAYVCIVRPLVQ